MPGIDAATRSAAPPPTQPAPAADGGLGGIFGKIGEGIGELVDKVEDVAKSILEKIEGGGPPTASENERIARKLVQAGGTGDQSDVDLVVGELQKMPVTALRAMEAGGVKVVACRGSVTDYATDLKGVQPRGWPPGATWTRCPGRTCPIATRW